MIVESCAITEIKVLKPRKFGDHRGFFAETYNAKGFADLGIDVAFVQDNHSYSAEAGTVRGFHFQTPPFEQAKLVRVVRGAILDVVLDVRSGSPTYGRSVSVELSAENFAQLYVPVGFAHAFVTLRPDTEVVYKVSNYYAPDHDKGVFWNDPDLGVEWPVSAEAAVVSDKDKVLPRLRDIEPFFVY